MVNGVYMLGKGLYLTMEGSPENTRSSNQDQTQVRLMVK